MRKGSSLGNTDQANGQPLIQTPRVADAADNAAGTEKATTVAPAPQTPPPGEQTSLLNADAAKKMAAVVAGRLTEDATNNDTCDALSTCFYGALLFLHPCAPLPFAVVHEGVSRCLSWRNGDKPVRGAITTDISLSYNATRADQSIPHKNVLPCGIWGVFAGAAKNAFSGPIP
ncbi:MAG: hypothetical protein NTU49_06730, partial [Gammaproteobacteria bacterium]|nr:hypothetical protein [Gammaproteobacteria bacterium]